MLSSNNTDANKLNERLDMGNTASSDPWKESFSKIKASHDSAYRCLDEAIILETEEKHHEAVEKYKEGIYYLDAGLSTSISSPQNINDPLFVQARSMVDKMVKARAQALMRINSIQSSEGFSPPKLPRDPPSYEEATSSSTSGVPNTYAELATALRQLEINNTSSIESEIVCSYEAKLFFISPTGEVVSTARPEKIQIVALQKEDIPNMLLHVGEWVYPLVPGVSPCYRTDYGAFIFPDITSRETGSSVGIILSPEDDEVFYDILETILRGIINQDAERDFEKRHTILPPPEEPSAKIANKIVNGAAFVSRGIIYGAEKAARLLDENIPKLTSRIRPSEEPTTIPTSVSKGVEIAECTTSKAVQITGFIAEQIGTATMKLGQFLAPHIEKQGTALLVKGFQMPEQEASSKVRGVLTVAAGAVEGFATVYNGLETSASILADNLKNNTVKVIQHKYGSQAGDVTEDTLNTVGNIVTVHRNTNVLNSKGLIKKAAKDTGKAVASNYASTSKALNEN